MYIIMLCNQTGSPAIELKKLLANQFWQEIENV